MEKIFKNLEMPHASSISKTEKMFGDSGNTWSSCSLKTEKISKTEKTFGDSWELPESGRNKNGNFPKTEKTFGNSGSASVFQANQKTETTFGNLDPRWRF